MAEGTNSMGSGNYNAENMDEESDEAWEEDMLEEQDYEGFGALGDYSEFSSFDMRLLQAFGSLGSGLRLLVVRPLPWPRAAPGSPFPVKPGHVGCAGWRWVQLDHTSNVLRGGAVGWG